MVDPMKILEQQIQEYKRKYNFNTEEEYVDSIDGILGYEELDHISSRYYGSHEYNAFINRYINYVILLTYEEKFKLLKELYCMAKDCILLGNLIQDLVKNNDIPIEEYENIKKFYKPKAYRGYNELNQIDGCSYTLDYDMAKWYSKRFECFGKKNGHIIEIDLDIDDIIFYNDNNEQEVFIRKDRLLNKNIKVIKGDIIE